MFTVKQYVKPSSLREAWELNQKRSNIIVGGMGWLKMSRRDFSTAIDLSELGLDKIEETDKEFIIGAMVTLRQLEKHKAFNMYFNNVAKESLKHIVGVQFRNCATIGGSVWLRPGFSDPLTFFMALDTYAELYTGEDNTLLVPLSEFCGMKRDRSLVLALHVKKDGRKTACESLRNTETDFPLLVVAVTKKADQYIAAVGARPAVAKQISADSIDELIKKAKELSYHDNLRGSASYRRAMSEVLIKRAAKQIEG